MQSSNSLKKKAKSWQYNLDPDYEVDLTDYDAPSDTFSRHKADTNIQFAMPEPISFKFYLLGQDGWLENSLFGLNEDGQFTRIKQTYKMSNWLSCQLGGKDRLFQYNLLYPDQCRLITVENTGAIVKSWQLLQEFNTTNSMYTKLFTINDKIQKKPQIGGHFCLCSSPDGQYVFFIGPKGGQFDQACWRYGIDE